LPFLSTIVSNSFFKFCILSSSDKELFVCLSIASVASCLAFDVSFIASAKLYVSSYCFLIFSVKYSSAAATAVTPIATPVVIAPNVPNPPFSLDRAEFAPAPLSFTFFRLSAKDLTVFTVALTLFIALIAAEIANIVVAIPVPCSKIQANILINFGNHFSAVSATVVANLEIAPLIFSILFFVFSDAKAF